MTIMDKRPWDSQNVTSILCVSQVLSQKAVLSFYKSMSPPPSPPNTMLKDQRNCALTVSTLSVGWGMGEGRTVLVARGYNFACVKKRSNCSFVPRRLSMIVAAVRGPLTIGSHRYHRFDRSGVCLIGMRLHGTVAHIYKHNK